MLLDLILVAIMLLSGFLAMLRGLTREMLALMSWALAALATWLLFQLYQPTLKQYFADKPQMETLGNVALASGIFLTVLIIASLITIKLSDKILDSRVGAVDRTLGFVFGMARGLLLVVISYELAGLFLRPAPDRPIRDGMPPWVKEANALPFVEQSGELIISVLPKEMKTFLRTGGREQPGAADESEGAPAGRRGR
jgi:membrane protein required for colicin V production